MCAASCSKVSFVHKYAVHYSCCFAVDPVKQILHPDYIYIYIYIFLFFFGVHPLRLTTTSSSSLNVGLTVVEEVNA